MRKGIQHAVIVNKSFVFGYYCRHPRFIKFSAVGGAFVMKNIVLCNLNHRILIKQLIIQATRAWKKQNLRGSSLPVPGEEDLFRNFSRLVEIHFRSKHSVAEYADLLSIAPKTLSTRLKRLKLDNPNDVIKNRIVLEAKRLLMYTDSSIKEVAYQLGYDDPAYFSRVFSQCSGCTPAAFRKSMT